MQAVNKVIVDVRLCPRCALPSPLSRPIGRIARAKNFPDSYLLLPDVLNDPFCCMTLLSIETSILQRTRRRRLHRRLPMLLNGSDNLRICPFPLGFRHPAGGGPSHGHSQHAAKNGKDRAYGSGDILADRQTDTHTDILITILPHPLRGRSKKQWLKAKFHYAIWFEAGCRQASNQLA